MSLGVSLAVHGVAAFSIVLAYRQPWAELDEGSTQVVGAQLDVYDRSLFDEPEEAPAFIVPVDVEPIPELEPLPPEALEPPTEWGLAPAALIEELHWDQLPPDLDPDRILQDPELPRRTKEQPEEQSVEAPVTPPEVAPETPVEAEQTAVADAPEGPVEAKEPAVVSPRAVPSDCPPPAYPRLAERRGWTGTVVLLIDVAADGSVTEVRVESSSGYDILDEAAVSAVRGWRFQPGTLGGEAAALVVRKPIRFGV
jgi:protein TonB